MTDTRSKQRPVALQFLLGVRPSNLSQKKKVHYRIQMRRDSDLKAPADQNNYKSGILHFIISGQNLTTTVKIQ